MLRMSLRRKIMLTSSTLLLALIVAMLAFVNYQAEKLVNERIAADLERGAESIAREEDERLAALRLTAQLVASFPELRALLATDFATIRDFLLAYQQENKRAELLIVLSPTGQVVARTDALLPVELPDAEARWAQPALANQSSTGILLTERGVYHAASVPAVAGGTVFGFVIAGASIDNSLAQALAERTQDDVVIVGERILATTLAEARLPWRNRADWEAALGQGHGPRTVEIAGETYATVPVRLGGASPPSLLAIILKSRDLALAPYRAIQLGLLLLGLLAAAAGIAGSAVLSHTLTASIAQLVEGTERVAAGNFETPLDIRSGDEIGDLADSFNTMMKGLRERADMQRFVSQSTVEMIQANPDRKASAGERQLLTIFFSDVRGFTTMSEKRPPEEVVKLLNSCLSLQAERVKRFQGDVDKFVGDSVVALFAGEDNTLNAIRCAIEIHRALDAYNAPRPDEEWIQVGIGIATGEVILGSIGSEDRRDYTAVGSNVNLCARLCSMAGPGEILLAESSYRQVEYLVGAERLEPLQLKGFSEPIPVYRIRPR